MDGSVRSAAVAHISDEWIDVSAGAGLGRAQSRSGPLADEPSRRRVAWARAGTCRGVAQRSGVDLDVGHRWSDAGSEPPFSSEKAFQPGGVGRVSWLFGVIPRSWMAADPKDTSVMESATAAADGAVDVDSAETAEAGSTKNATSTANKVRLNAADLIREFETNQLKTDLPNIYVGDTVRVGVRISEGNKERVQPYEGVVIAKRHGGLNQTITVRRIFQGIGVERVFMLHSPQVASIKVERRGKVRRAKLFYLRERVGKATRVKQRFDR